ncbi:MAG TPA: sigma-70 family RNA polymerase sigma factor [Candidatus Polarisedimenticolia bacterium]|nr:sigma-70 family RNA polymerase sigma factor [Candidatus Polarisedimenticolia bacterium]
MGRYSSTSPEELIRTCSASGDPEAWEEFVRRFHRLIAAVVLRTAGRLGDSSIETADDLIQETYLKLCADDFRLLREFDPRHPEAIFGYVKVVTANVVRDHFKSVHSQKRGVAQIAEARELFVPVADGNSPGGADAIEREILINDVRRHLEICTAGPEQVRNCKIFWLYYRAGLTASTIATLPEVDLTTKGVESLISRITRDLRKRMTVSKQNVEGSTLSGSEGIRPAESF